MPYAVRMYDERVAFLSLERLVWPDGPVCPHCREMSRLGRLNGLSTPVGAWKCYSCRKPFTVRHGTIFHNSHVPLHVWMQALYLMTATAQRVSSQRLGHILGVSVRTAWHLKVKIATGLDTAEIERENSGLWRPESQVIRCPVVGESAEAQPGWATCATRYSRFLAVLEGVATEEVDRSFIEALYRLLPVQPKQGVVPDDTCVEQQLELGLFSEPGCQLDSGFSGPGA
ncbi:transposase [Bosea lathyri]|uniref:Transposase zinc-ribbon domain-containing protein n=1 Tax=Bosea lathyri TaxID=1036778 RepID=A0A1H5S687_9HYPH|nr:transposase [Bosea lathyri]SEF45327.1 Transposase zinc-ribbon domain-containing protein [Bosea lathyri]